MFVHAFDPTCRKYYTSVVYALVRVREDGAFAPKDCDAAEEYTVLYNPLRACFEFVPRFDQTVRVFAGIPTLHRTVRYTILQPDAADWIAASDRLIDRLNPAVKHKVLSITGYAGVADNLPFFIRLIRQGAVPAAEANIPLRYPDDALFWTYIQSQEDADALLSEYHSFHDAVIDRMLYEEADDRTFRLTLTLGCDAAQIQLCFEGVMEMNLKTQIQWQREMAFGHILVSDAYTLWMFNTRTEEAIDKDTTYIKALNLKWRKID